MVFADRTLKCVDCGAEFVFSAGEQEFFQFKHFVNDPRRCKRCKAKRARASGRPPVEAVVVCSECGAQTSVPFKPRLGKPVLCRSCFDKQRANEGPPTEPGEMPRV